MHMICRSMPIPASTELTYFLYISGRKNVAPPFGAHFCWRQGAYVPLSPYPPPLQCTDLLTSNPFVWLIAFDRSKAFDTFCHDTFLSKTALLNIPDAIYNWLIDFCQDHEHCTKYGTAVVKLLNQRWSIPVFRRNSNMTKDMYTCVSVTGNFLRVHTHNTLFLKYHIIKASNRKMTYCPGAHATARWSLLAVQHWHRSTWRSKSRAWQWWIPTVRCRICISRW